MGFNLVCSPENASFNIQKIRGLMEKLNKEKEDRLNKKKKIEPDWIRDMEDQIEKCKLWEVEADRERISSWQNRWLKQAHKTI